MNKVKKTAAAVLSAALAAAAGDFWDTSGHAADLTSSVVSTGSAEAYFETGHATSWEVSPGTNVNTRPPKGVMIVVW